jgi:hypothetical protein
MVALPEHSAKRQNVRERTKRRKKRVVKWGFEIFFRSSKPRTLAQSGYRLPSHYPFRYPIIKDETFIGCASANITLDVLSRFLTTHRASPHSTTIIADPTKGTIIAYPDPKKTVRREGDHLELTKLTTIADENVREANRLHSQTNSDDFLFSSPQNGEEISASFTGVPGNFGQPWEIIILTPTDDFVGTLPRSASATA